MLEVNTPSKGSENPTLENTLTSDDIQTLYGVMNQYNLQPANLQQNNSTQPQLSLAKSFYQLGKIHYDKADLDSAAQCFKASLKLADLPKDSFSTLKVLGFLIR